MLSGAARLTPSIARMKSPTDDVDAGAGQRRAQVGVPALAVVDLRDLVAVALDREVGAEQPAGIRRHFRHRAAAHVRVADRDLRAHVVEQVVEVGAMRDVRQHGAVHLLHARPVRAVHVRHIQVVALQAPALVEDLRELRLRIEMHPQRHVEAAVAGRRRRPCRHRRGTAAAAPASRSGCPDSPAAAPCDRPASCRRR